MKLFVNHYPCDTTVDSKNAHNKVTESIHRIFNFFMNMKLNQKLLVGYFFIVIIPVIVFSSLLFNFNYRSAKEAYLKSQWQEMNNFNSQFTVFLEQISNYSYFFQNNKDILAYLDGQYTTTSEILYHYMDTFSDTFNCAAYDSRIPSLTIYGFKKYALTIPNKLEDMEAFTQDSSFITNINKSINGIWFWSKDGTLSFYRTLYDKTFHFPLGILRITTDVNELLRQMTANLEYSWYFSLPESPHHLFLYYNHALTQCTNEVSDDILSQSNNFLSMNLDIVSGQLIQPLAHTNYLRSHIFLYIAMTLIVLILFSFLYFAVARSLTKRLVDFNTFISKQEAHNLTIYNCVSFTDEIGNTISTYNELIQRINELIHNNYEVSLKMKEARYYALQAQIKPHFLYNILENIRMSSVSHNDPETARMTAVFGKYIRYAMNASTEADLLEKELQSAKDYLEVNKIRLGEYLTFNISVQTELDNLYCPRFILQPLLENSIKHGFQKNTPLHISIQIYGQDKSELSSVVYVEIKDTGSGIDSEHLKIIQDILYSEKVLPPSRHVGLRNVNDRLKAFHPNHQGLQIECPAVGCMLIRFSLVRNNNKPDY